MAPVSQKNRFLILITFLLYLCVEVSTNCQDDQGNTFFVGERIPADDKCSNCTCTDSGNVECAPVTCKPVMCTRGWVQQLDENGCCLKCGFGCLDANQTFYATGTTTTNNDTCQTCSCSIIGLICSDIECPPCNGILVVKDGECCGTCEGNSNTPFCVKNDTLYGIGDPVPTDDKCRNNCTCMAGGQIECDEERCLPCFRGMVAVPGEGCCPTCMSGCLDENNTFYEKGQEVDSGDPCEMCTCGVLGIRCITTECPSCPGDVVPVKGQCCGECFVRDVQIVPDVGCSKNGTVYSIGETIPMRNQCESCVCDEDHGVNCSALPCECTKDGVTYDVGPFIDPDNKCKSCECHADGTVTCETIKCPKPPCRQALRLETDDQCCPICQCARSKQFYMPGIVGDKCDGCVCADGEITCTPPVCPTVGVKCVDPEIGDDCCMHCPNGATCYSGSKVVKAGEFKKFGSKYCTCSADPWYPMAFCAPKKVKKTVLKKIGDIISDYTLPLV